MKHIFWTFNLHSNGSTIWKSIIKSFADLLKEEYSPANHYWQPFIISFCLISISLEINTIVIVWSCCLSFALLHQTRLLYRKKTFHLNTFLFKRYYILCTWTSLVPIMVSGTEVSSLFTASSSYSVLRKGLQQEIQIKQLWAGTWSMVCRYQCCLRHHKDWVFLNSGEIRGSNVWGSKSSFTGNRLILLWSTSKTTFLFISQGLLTIKHCILHLILRPDE